MRSFPTQNGGNPKHSMFQQVEIEASDNEVAVQAKNDQKPVVQARREMKSITSRLSKALETVLKIPYSDHNVH